MSINRVALLIFLSVSAGTDLCDGKIYNGWVAGGSMLAILLCLGNDAGRLLDRLAGALLPILLLLFFFRLGMLGGGDLKLLSMTGCFLGSRGILCCMALAFLTGAGVSLGRMLGSGTLRARLGKLGCYIRDSFLRRRLEPYEASIPKEAGIHLSVPILIGTWMYMEGML